MPPQLKTGGTVFLEHGWYEEMTESITGPRRTFLQAGAGSLALASLGLAGLAAAPAKLAAAPALAASPLAGLRPLYSRHSPAQANGPEAPAASDLPDPSVRALRRLTFGYRPEDQVAFQVLGGSFDQRLENWVNAQLDGYVASWPPVNDPPLSAIVNHPASNWETMGDSLATLWQERVVADPPWPLYQYPVIETQLMGLNRAIYSQWQLAEILADFWHTHFSIEGVRFGIAPVFVHYDRDVIRPNMLGNFRQMLEAVTTSTAMMYYLDNVSNTRWGPNENFAREVQELHTLGAVNSFGFTPENEIPEATPLAGSSTLLPAGSKGRLFRSRMYVRLRCA